MSSRRHLSQLVEETLDATILPSQGPYNLRACAEAVVDALLPEITDAKQLKGVPEGSVLTYPAPGGGIRALIWEDGKLWTASLSYDPAFIIKRYGPVTVVAMP